MDYVNLDSVSGLRNRKRTVSQTSSGSNRRTFQPKLRSRDSNASFASRTTSMSDQSEILSPTPRKHALLQTEQIEWLRAPWAQSPGPSARPSSPLNPNGSRTSSNKNPSIGSVMDGQQRPKRSRLHHRTKEDDRTGAGRRWVRWMSKSGMKHFTIPLAIVGNALFKWSISLGSYSGHATPPMFGDYEAQRHWMEITTNLPTSQWYTYDLPYWGLDYPPLTAYHSWLGGKIGSLINPEWFQLGASRGIETGSSKIFMRATVLASDFIIYVPAILTLINTWNQGRSTRTKQAALLLLLFHPALLLIDFGHFQYNSVMLGLTVHAINFFASGRDALGCIAFVLSLGFKQMALYYAPIVGAYLLGKIAWTSSSDRLQLLTYLGTITVGSFAILFLPFLNPTSLSQVVTRIFPFNRGLFEDKVANFWCASDVIFKWRNISFLGRAELVRLSGALTFLGFLPGVFSLIYGGWSRRLQAPRRMSDEESQCPTIPLLPYALFTCSMSFFLFSFQVHEKTILLPLLPLTIILSSATPGSVTWDWAVLVNNIAVFSMLPLLQKDGLTIQTYAATIFWNWLIGSNPWALLQRKTFVSRLSIVAYLYMVTLQVLQLFVAPPARYPDIFPVLNVLCSAGVFGLSWLWSIKRGIEVNWALGGLSQEFRSEHMATIPEKAD